MHIEPFHLERWLNAPRSYDLASAGITKLQLGDLVDGLDPGLVMGYGLTKGSSEIRAGITRLYEGVGPDQVLVTTGAAEANWLALYRLLEPGDEIVVLTPTYLQGAGIARSLGAIVKYCRLEEEDGFRFDRSALKRQISSRTRMILCVNPNNPTGTILSAAELDDICSLADDVDAWVLCDGALRGLEKNGRRSATPLAYTRGISTGSLSKVGITGIRIGWLIADRTLVEECWACKDYTTLCHSGIGEHLASAALAPGRFDRFVGRAQTVIRDQSGILDDWVRENSKQLEWVEPQAGHTGLLRYRLEIPSIELCRRLLDEEEVLMSPGDYFDAPFHLRVRYSCGKDELIEGLRRTTSFLSRQA